MKIIFSRKGWDKTSVGKPSPIFEDNTMLSLPIPRKDGDIKYSELSYKGISLEKIIQDLYPKFKQSKKYFENCHPDPAINNELYPSISPWQPASGHRGDAGSHLDNEGVSEGDIILFYGLFQKVKEIDGKFKYDPEEPIIHAIYGYMEIGKILRDPEEIKKLYPWHPHAHDDYTSNPNNRLYIPKQNRCAVFKYSEPLRLTAQQNDTEYTIKKWQLPYFFKYPEVTMSYNLDKNEKIKIFKNYTELETTTPGQEFVVTVPDEMQDELSTWVEGIIEAGTKR